MNTRHDGIVYLATLTNTADAGDMPKDRLQYVGRFWYEERMIGLQRQYAARGAREQIDMVIRIREIKHTARIGLYAVLGNGDQFRILNVSRGFDDEHGLKFTELTLERLDRLYDINQEFNNGENQENP